MATFFPHWDPGLALGIPDMDAQHQELFAAIHRLGRAMSEGRGGEEVGATLDFLADYVATHFREEEALMKAARFPGLVNHQWLHRTLEARLKEFQARRNEGRVATDFALVEFLNRWLRDHIQHQDRSYVPYVWS